MLSLKRIRVVCVVFSVSWFKKYDWLEYSVHKDAAFCFICYLFKDKTSYPGGDTFVNGGFNTWNKPERLKKHVGGIGSGHNEAVEKYDFFMNQKSSIPNLCPSIVLKLVLFIKLASLTHLDV